MQFISQQYLVVCICLLAVQIGLLVAAIRTEKDVFYIISMAMSALSAVITFNIPCAKLDIQKACILSVAIVIDAVLLIVAAALRASEDEGARWKTAWVVIVLGAAVWMLADKLAQLLRCYNSSGGGFSRLGLLEDTLFSLVFASLYAITLFVSWVFWMNRKEN